jgi:hypothetical protein
MTESIDLQEFRWTSQTLVAVRFDFVQNSFAKIDEIVGHVEPTFSARTDTT